MTLFDEFQFLFNSIKFDCTWCFDTLRPHPLHSITGQYHTRNLYIFMTTHQFQINMQIFRASTLFTYFRSHDLSFKVEHIFVTNFCFIFWGCFRKIVIKLSIISVDPYMIPHCNANKPQNAIELDLGPLYNHASFCSHLNGSKARN